MKSKFNNKGLSFVSVGEISKDTELKLNKMIDAKKERIRKIAEDFANGILVLPETVKCISSMYSYCLYTLLAHVFNYLLIA